MQIIKQVVDPDDVDSDPDPKLKKNKTRFGSNPQEKKPDPTLVKQPGSGSDLLP